MIGGRLHLSPMRVGLWDTPMKPEARRTNPRGKKGECCLFLTMNPSSRCLPFCIRILKFPFSFPILPVPSSSVLSRILRASCTCIVVDRRRIVCGGGGVGEDHHHHIRTVGSYKPVSFLYTQIFPRIYQIFGPLRPNFRVFSIKYESLLVWTVVGLSLVNTEWRGATRDSSPSGNSFGQIIIKVSVYCYHSWPFVAFFCLLVCVIYAWTCVCASFLNLLVCVFVSTTFLHHYDGYFFFFFLLLLLLRWY